MAIDPTARVSQEADLAADVEVGPYAILEPGVKVGDGSSVAAHAVLKAGTRLGREVRVHEGAILGGEPQDLKFQDAPSYVEIGDRTVVREMATVHRSASPGGITRVGPGCLIMAYGHVAHDCILEDDVILASQTALAGHVFLGSRAFISGGVVIHQFTRVGELALVGGGAKIIRDVPPYFIVDGAPGRAMGVNVVGLRRAGWSAEDIRTIKEAYRLLYRSRLTLEEARVKIEALGSGPARRLADFIGSSERGISAARRGGRDS